MSSGWQLSTAEFRAVTRSKGLIVCVALVYRRGAKGGNFVHLDATTKYHRLDGL